MDDVLVLWDIDGTLLNSGGVGRELYDTVFRQLFGRALPMYAPMAGRTDRAIILETLSLAGIPEPRRYVDPFIAELSELAAAACVEAALAAKGRALPGAIAAIAELGSRSSVRPPGAPGLGGAPGPAGGLGPAGRIYQSVLTGNVRRLAEAKLGAVGLRAGLDMCIGAFGDDHEDRAELVHVARRRAAGVYGSTPEAFAGQSAVVIGDTPLDIAAALNAGARAIGLATGSHSLAELRAAGPHAVLADLSDPAAVLAALVPGLGDADLGDADVGDADLGDGDVGDGDVEAAALERVALESVALVAAALDGGADDDAAAGALVGAGAGIGAAAALAAPDTLAAAGNGASASAFAPAGAPAGAGAASFTGAGAGAVTTAVAMALAGPVLAGDGALAVGPEPGGAAAGPLAGGGPEVPSLTGTLATGKAAQPGTPVR
jgi:phosphoglycolate phosphatase-like HAD superfamily hydrolase